MLKLPSNHARSEFWKKYPDNEEDFLECVRKGIWFRVYNDRELPEPPDGYDWRLDMGGPRIRNGQRTYRLWTIKLGYMLGSE